VWKKNKPIKIIDEFCDEEEHIKPTIPRNANSLSYRRGDLFSFWLVEDQTIMYE